MKGNTGLLLTNSGKGNREGVEKEIERGEGDKKLH